MSGLSVSVESRRADRKRLAEQSSPSTDPKNGPDQATRETSAVNPKSRVQPGAVTLGDLSPKSANNHWAALNRFRFASPAVATLTATKADAIVVDVDGDGKADPGDTLEYTVVVTNTSAMDATNTVFTDTLTDANLMFVPGSVMTTPLARNDSYTGLVGNVSITKSAANGVLANDSDPDGVGPALTASAGTTSTQGGTVSMNADGSFTYDPPAGYEGADTFTYTLSDGEGNTDTATVTITIMGMVWFIDNNSGSCTSNCDGRLSHPFTTLSGFQAVNDGVGNHPAANDNIFLYESSTAYTGPVTLLSGQKLIGQDATVSLSDPALTGLTPPADSPSFPAMNSGNGTITKITSAGNAINISSGNNTIRGLTVGSTTGIGINSGASFGTLTVADADMSDSPNRTGQALSLATGTLAATFANIKSTNSSAAGIALTSVGGSLTSGSTSITNPGTIGISVGTSSATLNFNNTTSTMSGGTGISLLTNTGTITFGALTITPDANQRGLLATDNTNTITIPSGTITTSGAIACEITKSSTSTPLAVSLTSVSANGGASGIVLTRTSGSFTITGSGNTSVGGDNSGGTIQNTTSHGIALTSTTNTSFTNVKIQNTAGSGIKGVNPGGGSQVNGFTFQNGTIDNTGTGGGVDESNIAFNSVPSANETNLIGTVSITKNSLTNSHYHGVDIQQFNGTIGSLTISNNTLTSNAALANSLGSAIRITVHGTASVVSNITGATIAGNTITNFPSGGGVIVQGGNTTSAGAPSGTLGTVATPISITGNTIAGPVGTRMATQGVNMSSAGHGTAQFDISNNNVSQTQGVGIAISAFGFVTASGTMNNNSVNSNSNVNGQPGYNPGADVQFTQADTPVLNIKMDGNSSTNTQGSGILAITRGNGTMNITIINSNIAAPLGGVRPGIRVESGNNAAGEGTTVCTDIRTNTSAGSGGTNGIGLRLQTGNAADHFGVEGMAATSSPGVESYVSGLNPNGNGVLLISATSGFSNCSSAPNAPVMNGSKTEESSVNATAESKATGSSEDILYTTGGKGPGGNDLRKVTQAEVLAMAQAAIERWREAGITASDLMRLQAVTFEIANLPDGQLATATSTSVKIDETAAGYGWYLDTAPMDDTEFDVAVPGRELQTTEQSPAFGRMDLLTVVMRELGHVYKQGKKSVIKGLRPLMQNTLSPAVRRVPNSQKIKLPTPVVGVSGASQSSNTTSPVSQASTVATSQPKTGGASSSQSIRRMNHATMKRAGAGSLSAMPVAPDVNLNIGTLPANKAITIKFRAQIKSPLATPAGSVSNQGHVHADGPIDLDTDDPAIAGTSNPTVTPLDVADVKVAKTDSADPVTAGNNLTYTVTVTNDGPSDAVSVQLTDAVPANTTFVSLTQGAGPTFICTDPGAGSGTGNVSCSRSTLAAGASQTFDIVVHVNADTPNGTSLSNTATVSSSNTVTDPNSSNNTKTETTLVQARADLKLDKVGPPAGIVGDPAGYDYTLTVTNNGPSNNTGGFTVTDTLPTGVTFHSTGSSSECSAVGQVVTCTYNTGLAVLGTKVFTLHVTVDPTVIDSVSLQNSATVASNGTLDPTSGNNTSNTVNTIAQAKADLSITKSGPSTAVAGDAAGYDYTLTVTNNGPSNNTGGFTVTDTLPTGVTFHSTGSSSECSAVGQVVTCTYNTGLAVLGTKVFTLHVTVASSVANGTVLSNTAAVASNGTTDPISANNNTSLTPVTTTVSTSADIQVTKSDSADPVVAGTELIYTVTITNNGPSDAQTVKLIDAVPMHTTFVSEQQNSGPTFNCTNPSAGSSTGNVSCERSTLASGASAVFEIKVKVDANAVDGSSISNTATGSSDTADPNVNNTTKTETTLVQARADLKLDKVGPSTAVAGEATGYDYTLTVTNNGPSNNTGGFTVTDTLPGGLTFQSTGSSSECSAVGQAVTCTTNTGLAVLGTKQFTVHVTLGSYVLDGTVLSNTATVASGGTTDPTSGNNTSITVNTTVQAKANLQVTKTASPDPAVTAGNELTYTITVTNNGPSDAQSLLLSDTTPGSTTFVSFSIPAGWTRTDNPLVGVGGTGTVKAEVSTLAAGASAQFTFVVKVNTNTPPLTLLSNSATVTTATTDPDTGNNTGTATTTVNARPDLEVVSKTGPAAVMMGENISYHIVVKNNGPSNATNVVIKDKGPSSSVFDSATLTPNVGSCSQANSLVTCTISSMASGAMVTLDIVVKTTGNPNTVFDTATVSASETDPIPGNNQKGISTRVVGFYSFAFLPASVSGSCPNAVGNAVGTLTLTDKAPPGVTINFMDNSAALADIGPVTTVGGEKKITVMANTSMVTADQIATVTATNGTNSIQGRLKIVPVRVKTLTLNPPGPVQGGTPVTGTITLACATPTPLTVTITSNKGAAKPDVTHVMFNVGDVSKQFTITTKSPGVAVTATITATGSNGGSAQATLKVNP